MKQQFTTGPGQKLNITIYSWIATGRKLLAERRHFGTTAAATGARASRTADATGDHDDDGDDDYHYAYCSSHLFVRDGHHGDYGGVALCGLVGTAIHHVYLSRSSYLSLYFSRYNYVHVFRRFRFQTEPEKKNMLT